MVKRILFIAILMSFLLAFGCAPKLQSPVLAPQSKVDSQLYGYASEVKGEQLFFEGERVYGISISENGQYILLHRFGGDVVIEPTSSWTYELPKATVGATFSPDNECIAIPDADGVKIVKLRGQDLVREWGSQEEPRRIAFSPDGNLIAVTMDESIQVLDVESGKIVFEKSVENAYVAFSPDSQKLAVLIRNNISGPPVGIDTITTAMVMSYWLLDATVGVVDDDEFFLYDLENGQMLIERTAVDEVVRSVKLSPDGRLLAVAKVNDWETSFGGALEVYDTTSGKKIYSWPVSQSLMGISFSPTGENITTYSPLAEGGLITYSLKTGGQQRQLSSDSVAKIMDVEYSPDGRYMAIAVSIHPVRGQGAVILYDAEKERVLYSRITDEPVYDVAFFPNGDAFAVAGADGVRTIPVSDFLEKKVSLGQ